MNFVNDVGFERFPTWANEGDLNLDLDSAVMHWTTIDAVLLC